MTDKTPENPPGGACYKTHTYAPTGGWPVPQYRIDETRGPARQCVTCGYHFVPDGHEPECVLCREMPGWEGKIDPDYGAPERDPRDFAWCWVCGKPFLHNDIFPENGDESGVWSCETCVEAKLASGEWRECGWCDEIKDRDRFVDDGVCEDCAQDAAENGGEE